MTRTISAGVLTIVYVSSLLAEPQFLITGRVTDAEGAVIAKARVLVHWDSSGSKVGVTGNGGTTQDVSVLTDAHGGYSARVSAGFYDVFISAPAFTPTAAKVIVRQGQPTTLSVKLRVDPLVSKEIGGMKVYAAPGKR
jgi:hypothetical protein